MEIKPKYNENDKPQSDIQIKPTPKKQITGAQENNTNISSKPKITPKRKR